MQDGRKWATFVLLLFLLLGSPSPQNLLSNAGERVGFSSSDCPVACFFCTSDAFNSTANARLPRTSFSNNFPLDVKLPWSPDFSPRKSAVRFATGAIDLSKEEINAWEACRPALSAFGFSVEEQDKILGKAFGQISSPYWSEERERKIPKRELINETLDYLRSLSLSDDDLSKILKKFPEVLGCSLEHEVKNNVKVLDAEWGIKGKTLRNLLLRNPKVLGYNVDCKGDCMARCTRCWSARLLSAMRCDFTFPKVMNVVPCIWHHLMLTFFCIFAVAFAYKVGSSSLGHFVRDSSFGLLVMFFLRAAYAAGFLYKVWQLASMVTVLKERRLLFTFKQANNALTLLIS